jgi:hypothetical protein
MPPAVVGYALDVALLGLTGYLISSSPLVADARAHGVAAVWAGLADGPRINASAPLVWAPEDPALHRWYTFLAEDNLGRYGNGPAAAELARMHANNAWLNTLILPTAVVEALPHVAAVWLRNCLAGWALYYVCGGLWAFWIYWVFGAYFFPNPADKPDWDSMFTQMKVRAA